MQKPILVVMAAGMGSRFGGLKQISPIGPNGEKLIEYSVYDAIQAGFGKVVFIIKHAIEEDFREQIGQKLEKILPVEYVFQELNRLPGGFPVPQNRVKPWGTGHAVSCCTGVVHEPFAVINADDYYGAQCFSLLADFLKNADTQKCQTEHLAMVGYVLENTLTDNGYVSRGVCETDANGMLTAITERTHIQKNNGNVVYTENEGKTWNTLPKDAQVSMNCWGFPASVLPQFEELFVRFLENLSGEQAVKAEFYLPFAVDSLMQAGKADVKVLHTQDKWYGMTYREDLAEVTRAIARMTNEGRYPAPLWPSV